MVWSDIRLVMAKFQEQISRKPDLNNIKKCYYSYIEFCDSMVFGIDPRSRLKSELALSEMRLVLVASRSAIIFLAGKAIIRGSVLE